jgi:hypothetical protein
MYQQVLPYVTYTRMVSVINEHEKYRNIILPDNSHDINRKNVLNRGVCRCSKLILVGVYAF